MQGSKWAPNSSDPFAKLQAAYRTNKNTTRAMSELTWRKDRDEFMQDADLMEFTPARAGTDVTHRQRYNVDTDSTAAASRDAGTKTLPNPRVAEFVPGQSLAVTSGSSEGSQNPRETGMGASRYAPASTIANDASFVAAPTMTPTQEADDGLADLEKWEAEERRRAEREIAEKKRLLLEKRKLLQMPALSSLSTVRTENKPPEISAHASSIATQNAYQQGAEKQSGTTNARSAIAASPRPFFTEKGFAPSVFGSPQPPMLAAISPNATTFPRSAQASERMVSPTSTLSTLPTPKGFSSFSSTSNPAQKSQPERQSMSEERAAHDKERELKRTQMGDDAKNAFLRSSTAYVGLEPPLKHELPPPSAQQIAPAANSVFSFTVGTNAASNSAALDKLHSRPAERSSAAPVGPGNPIKPVGSRPLHATIPAATRGAAERAVPPSTDSNQLVNSLDRLTIEPKLAIPPPLQKRPATTMEDEFLKSTQGPAKRPHPSKYTTAPKTDAKQTNNAANALPVDKLAFTLRSSSREIEIHPSKVVTPARDPLATAHAAMNEIDRTNVKTQGELQFKAWPKPQDRLFSFVRRVNITGLPVDFTATQVLSLVWGGRVERVDYKSGSGQATVLFMKHEDCENYYNATCNGVDIPGQAERFALVKLADRNEAAHEFLRGLIAVGATRCIRAIGVSSAFGMTALSKLALGGKREVERIVNGVNPKGLRTVEFRFLNVYDAMRFKSELEKSEDWEACNIFCAPDPCAMATGVHTGVGL